MIIIAIFIDICTYKIMMDQYELNKVNTERYKKTKDILKKTFNHDNFKPHQYEIIDTILNENDCIAVMPTGYGKSLCFQMPPLVSNELAIIISPLIALMADQQMILDELGIIACCYNSAISGKKKLDLEKDLIKGKYQIMYITPESLIRSYILLDQIYENQGICMIAIDEAHCISSYGFDFRTSYRELHKVRPRFPNVPVLAVTATATDKVINDIKSVLSMEKCKLIKTSFDRPNLTIYVKMQSGDMINDIKDIIEDTDGTTIIYCVTQKDTEKVAEALTTEGIEAKPYHSGLGIKERSTTQEGFMKGEFNCIVATIAFGMGINKADVRTVIHYGCPQNIESYYQEIGRAGRDGNESNCYLFYKQKDFVIQRLLIDKIGDPIYKSTRSNLLSIISRYVGMNTCRRRYILEYFGEVSKELNCNKCDNCMNEDDKIVIDKEDEHKLYQLISIMNELNTSYGFSALTMMLKGSTSTKMTKSMKNCTHFGSMSGLKVKDINDFIHKAVDCGYVELYDVGNCVHALKCSKNGLIFYKDYAEKLEEIAEKGFNKNVKNKKLSF